MLGALINKTFGSRNKRYLRSLQPLLELINAHEPAVRALCDEEFPIKYQEYRNRHHAGESLDALLPQVFALVREAGRRTLSMRHFDVQCLGGIILHTGKIAEMKTGEGKTLVATLAVVLNSLSGKGVHVVTVNDYLARRDATWMNKIYNFLGITVGSIVHGMDDRQRQKAYAADVTYGTNNEFGFDYLRDNMKFYKEQLVQRPLHYCIIDEVDSILIDEARTPLIISGQAEDSTALYTRINSLIPMLKPEMHYTCDEKFRSVTLTEEGIAYCENILQLDNLYDPTNTCFQHHILQAIKAHRLFKRDVDYISKDGQVIIVDEFTGRLMPGRRYSDGLHQAIEAKEGLKVEPENQTLASITFQNYFRIYTKLAGMTGTADTEAIEFRQIYNLEVISIPTHRPMIRKDFQDAVYKTQQEKYEAIIKAIIELYEKGQPILVGTISIEKSELISSMLVKLRVPHEVLNAKHHEREAEIIATAGQQSRVTIATNMAGRGTDIVLEQGVVELDGMHIIGTERHESRRIDNQLRGRAGRQGDPGSSRFYLALDDDLLRLFGSDRITGIMNRLGMKDGQAIENPMVSRAIENAQRRVENHNFETRKLLLEYDNVMNQQREVIYSLRREAMTADDVDAMLKFFVQDLFEDIYGTVETDKGKSDKETIDQTRSRIEEIFWLSRFLDLDPLPARENASQAVVNILDHLKSNTADHYQEILRFFLLENLDRCWKEHLQNMDYLRQGIGLRGYGQKDPKQEYKREGFERFQAMLCLIKESTLRALMRVRLEHMVEGEFIHKSSNQDLNYSGSTDVDTANRHSVSPRRRSTKVGRNAPCPCGSSKKYKKCHGATR